jgi:hypothetical protein
MSDKNIQIELWGQAPVLAVIYSELYQNATNPDYFASMQHQVLTRMGIESNSEQSVVGMTMDIQQKILDTEKHNRRDHRKASVVYLPWRAFRYAAVLLVLVISGLFIRNQIHQNHSDLISDDYLISFIEDFATEKELMWLMDEEFEKDFLAGFSDDFLLREYLKDDDADLDFLYFFYD